MEEEIRNLEVKEDPELLTSEKETYLRIDAVEPSKLKVATNMKPYIKWLKEVEGLEVTRFYADNGKLIHLEGTIPLSSIRFKTRTNESMDYASRIIAS